MSTTTTAAPAVQPRPGLALILALLGLPGCTIAWALPAGGFWIGVPLAAAAIVLGLRARPYADQAGRRMAIAAIALGAVEILFMATWTVAG
jgi:hypothetical protein